MINGMVIPEHSGTLLFRTTCPFCGEPAELTGLDPNAFAAWQSGVYVQNAFPGLSADQREILVSGTHGECFDQLFPEEEE